MSIITLVSGGLDSSLMSLLISESKLEHFPLFINYGQLSFEMEWNACKKFHSNFKLPTPELIDIKGYGQFFPCGITDKNKEIKEEAFLPNRNALFLLIGSSYAFIKKSDSIAIGLLNENTHLFPDQTDIFLNKFEDSLELSLGRRINIITPLREFYKKDVVELAKSKGIYGTYSCHSGEAIPCGQCISCEEFQY
jgi:7-cyano-7-deazaguanine synthase